MFHRIKLLKKKKIKLVKVPEVKIVEKLEPVIEEDNKKFKKDHTK
jgi:hypothetical protein